MLREEDARAEIIFFISHSTATERKRQSIFDISRQVLNINAGLMKRSQLCTHSDTISQENHVDSKLLAALTRSSNYHFGLDDC